MPFQSWILLFVALLNLLFVGVLSGRATRTTANRLFVLAIFCNVFWSVGDSVFFGANDRSVALLGSQLFFIAPLFTAYFLLLFTFKFYDDRPMRLDRTVVLTIPPILLSIVILLDQEFLIETLSLGDFNTYTVNQVPFIIYTLFFSVYFGLSYLALFLKSRKKSGVERSQLVYILYAAIMSSFLALLSNLSLPLMGITEYIWLGPIFTLFYVVIVAFSIVRHKLFNIRATVARAMAYLASIGSMLLIYVGVIFFFSSSTDIVASNLTTLQRVSFAMVAVLSGLLFQPFKRFFDKVTNRLFYRDAYDAQGLIDELNNTLVANVDLESLLTKTALVIQENLKTSFVTFYIRKTSYFDDRIIGAHRKKHEYEHLEHLQNYASKIKHKVHSTEIPSEREEGNKLTAVMRKNDIEVLARLVSTLDYDVKGVGYIFVGSKRSGSPYSKQDLKILEIIANELVIAVENVLRIEEIEQFNVTLQKKIDAATKELKHSNDKLKALDEAKDEFVSMASHQLRTPLTSIKGYISMVLEGDAGKINETQEKMLGQAFFSSQRMVYLIADLLNVSRLKTGKFLIEKSKVNLADIVEDEIGQLTEGASSKNLTLAFKKPADFPLVELDEFKIRQVIMNFIDNAIYYTPSGGKITVALKETSKTVELTVKDSGIGVPKSEQHKLFAKFYRADNARKARPDGTGLGIFMAKKVIVAQGGSILFESKEGKGSTFGFSFPKDKVVAPKTDVKDE